jgi:phospholipase D
MKGREIAFVVGVLIILLTIFTQFQTPPIKTPTSTSTTIAGVESEIWVYFPSIDNCSDKIIKLIDRANSTLRIEIYSFTLDNVGDAIIRAEKRGIDVKMIMEPEELSVSGSEYTKLQNAGISITVDKGPGIMHDKVMIVDSKYVVTGSFNWSNNAENQNAENMIIIKNPYVIQEFEQEWDRILLR